MMSLWIFVTSRKFGLAVQAAITLGLSWLTIATAYNGHSGLAAICGITLGILLHADYVDWRRER